MLENLAFKKKKKAAVLSAVHGCDFSLTFVGFLLVLLVVQDFCNYEWLYKTI